MFGDCVSGRNPVRVARFGAISWFGVSIGSKGGCENLSGDDFRQRKHPSARFARNASWEGRRNEAAVAELRTVHGYDPVRAQDAGPGNHSAASGSPTGLNVHQ